MRKSLLFYCHVITYRPKVFYNVQTTPAWNYYIYYNFRYFLLSSISCLSRILKINPAQTDNRISHIVINIKNMQKCVKVRQTEVKILILYSHTNAFFNNSKYDLVVNYQIIIFISCCMHTPICTSICTCHYFLYNESWTECDNWNGFNFNCHISHLRK